MGHPSWRLGHWPERGAGGDTSNTKEAVVATGRLFAHRRPRGEVKGEVGYFSVIALVRSRV